MSPELQGVIIGGSIGILGSLLGIFVNHWLTVRRENYALKLEIERELRKKLTEGVSPNIYNKGLENLYKMIDEGKLPRAYVVNPRLIDDYLDNIEADDE